MQRYPNREHYLNSLQNAFELQQRAYSREQELSCPPSTYPGFGEPGYTGYPGYGEAMNQGYSGYAAGYEYNPKEGMPHLDQMVELNKQKLWVSKKKGVRYATPYKPSKDKKNPKAPKFHGAVVANFGKKKGRILIVPNEGEKHKAHWGNMKNAHERELVNKYRAKVNGSRPGGWQLYKVPVQTVYGWQYTYQWYRTGQQQRRGNGGKPQQQQKGKGGKPQKRRKPQIKEDPYGVVGGLTQLIKKLAEEKKKAEKSETEPPENFSDPQYHFAPLLANIQKLREEFDEGVNFFKGYHEQSKVGGRWQSLVQKGDRALLDKEKFSSANIKTAQDRWNVVINEVKKVKKAIVGAIHLMKNTEKKEKQADAFIARVKKSFPDVSGHTVKEIVSHAAEELLSKLDTNYAQADNMRFEKGVLLAVASAMVQAMSWTDYVTTTGGKHPNLLKFAMKHQAVFKKALKNAKSKHIRAEKKANPSTHHEAGARRATVEVLNDSDEEDEDSGGRSRSAAGKRSGSFRDSIGPSAGAHYQPGYSSMSLRS